MNRKGLGLNMWGLILLAAIMVVGGGIAFSGSSVDVQSNIGGSGDTAQVSCGDDDQCTYSVTWQNALNSSSTEKQNVTWIIKSKDGAINTQFSNSDDTDVTLDAGKTYTLEVDSSSNVNSRIYSSTVGEVQSDGTVEFVAKHNSADVVIRGANHGMLEARAYDESQAGFLNENESADNTDYQGDPAEFESTTDGSAIDVASGESLSVRYDIQQQNSNEEFSDRGVIVGVKADSTIYNTPSLSFNGESLTEIGTSGLPSEESVDAIGSTYDYFYKLPAGAFNGVDETGTPTHNLNFDISAKSGQDPAFGDSIEVDFVAVGTEQVNGEVNELFTTTHDDDSSLTATYTIFDTLLSVK